MSTLSDINSFLEFNGTLNDGDSWESNKVLLNAYASMTITFYATTDITMTLSFSNDGINFDVNITKSWTGLLKDYYTSVIYGKFTKVKLENNSGSNSDIRMYTYVNVQNASLNAVISKVGNKSPQISVDNLPLTAFGELMVAEDMQQTQYMFCTGGSGLMASKTWTLPYSDVYTFSNNALAALTISNGVAKFGAGITSNQYATLSGGLYTYRPSTGIESRFTSYFTQGGGNFNTTVLSGIGNLSAQKPHDGYYFGYIKNSAEFGIAYYNNGSRTFYPKSQWNVDKCDGTYLMPIIDFTKMQVYEITFQYLGFGMVRFYIENPSTGLPQLVHTINRVNLYNTPSNLSIPSLGMLIYIENEFGVVPIADSEVGVASFAYRLQGQPMKAAERIALVASKNAVSAEAVIANIRCDTSFYAATNNYPCDIDYITTSADGTKNVIVRLYKNSTLGGVVSWSTPYATLLPINIDTGGTLSTPGTLLLAYVMDKTGKTILDNLEHIHLHLNPGDIITVTAQSASNTDIILTASCRFH